MTAAWPSVAARLVSLFSGSTSAPVYDGPPTTSAAPPDYVTVGYVEDDNAGTYFAEAIYDGSMYQETGTVVSQIVAQSGNADVVACRTRAFVIEQQLRDAVKADHTLGVLSRDGTSTLTTDVQVVQNSNGSAVSLVLTYGYTTTY
jgi:hypothetical protein